MTDQIPDDDATAYLAELEADIAISLLATMLAEAAQIPDRAAGNQQFVSILTPFDRRELMAIIASLARPLFSR